MGLSVSSHEHPIVLAIFRPYFPNGCFHAIRASFRGFLPKIRGILLNFLFQSGVIGVEGERPSVFLRLPAVALLINPIPINHGTSSHFINDCFKRKIFRGLAFHRYGRMHLFHGLFFRSTEYRPSFVCTHLTARPPQRDPLGASEFTGSKSHADDTTKNLILGQELGHFGNSQTTRIPQIYLRPINRKQSPVERSQRFVYKFEGFGSADAHRLRSLSFGRVRIAFDHCLNLLTTGLQQHLFIFGLDVTDGDVHVRIGRKQFRRLFNHIVERHVGDFIHGQFRGRVSKETCHLRTVPVQLGLVQARHIVSIEMDQNHLVSFKCSGTEREPQEAPLNRAVIQVLLHLIHASRPCTSDRDASRASRHECCSTRRRCLSHGTNLCTGGLTGAGTRRAWTGAGGTRCHTASHGFTGSGGA
eukprot:m.80056 g.80056  ORF g.80056 m.80056 type:complete len:415 (-) comp9319_c0_seq3:533-1777(-)